jgi:hypothetical protein
MSRRAIGLRAGALVPALGLALPAAARACAACGADGGASRAAFFWTTVLLSLLPLGMFAAGIAILVRTARGRLREEFADRDEAGGPAAPAAPRG